MRRRPDPHRWERRGYWVTIALLAVTIGALIGELASAIVIW